MVAAKQGITIGSTEKRTYICWNPGGKEVPNPDEFGFQEREPLDCHTDSEYQQRLRKALNGYIKDIEDTDEAVIIGLDAATTGRLSITYFNELSLSDYLIRLKDWACSCRWFFTEFTKAKKPYDKVKTPNVRQIITYAYGTQQGGHIDVNDKILKEQSQRVYYCMLDKQPLPKDLVHALFIKASMPMAYTYGNHERILSVACALIQKYHSDKKKGGIEMELNQNNHDRSYLFGRLLAIAEKVEKSTYKGEEARTTNAIRLQAAFVNHPMRTWGVLESALIPYYQKLTPQSAEFYKIQIENIVTLLQEKDQEILNKSLDESYLIGYYLQRKSLRFDKNKNGIHSEGEEG